MHATRQFSQIRRILILTITDEMGTNAVEWSVVFED